MATWKKVVVSGSAISQLNNDANYLVDGQAGAELTGSFTGSFHRGWFRFNGRSSIKLKHLSTKEVVFKHLATMVQHQE
jgi:hypothetical protein